MACFNTLGSAIAWYCGDVPEILDLQANFHRIRNQIPQKQPSMFRCKSDVFELLKPYYKSKDLLIYQLRMAQDMYDVGQMNYAHLKRSGCQDWKHKIAMQERLEQAQQLNFPLSRY
jgi:adenosine deaminase